MSPFTKRISLQRRGLVLALPKFKVELIEYSYSQTLQFDRLSTLRIYQSTSALRLGNNSLIAELRVEFDGETLGVLSGSVWMSNNIDIAVVPRLRNGILSGSY